MSDEQQTAGNEVAPEIDPLAEALAEFDQQTDQPKPQQTNDAVSRDEFDELKRQYANLAAERGVNDAVAAFRQEMGDAVSEGFARDHLHGVAATNPKFAAAFEQRHENPDAWNKAVKAVAEKVKGELGGPSEDDVSIESVRAAANAQPNTPVQQDEDENAKARQMAEQDPFGMYQT